MLITTEESISAAWLSATESLLEAGGDVFTSIVNVTNPALPPTTDAVRHRLDDFLRKEGLGDTQTVAGTMMPDLAHMSDPTQIYDRYETYIWPVIRRHRQNQRGTYFRRLIYLPIRKPDGTVEVKNPLDDTIKKMQRQLKGRSPLRCAYELAVYRPSEDAGMQMGFPCLSHVSFKIDGGQLHLTAFYRNQLYLARMYGNLLGLARILQFAATQTRLNIGQLVCHAGHAQLDPNIGRRKMRTLLKQCRMSMDRELHLTIREEVPKARAHA
jgi:hypothetical protein